MAQQQQTRFQLSVSGISLELHGEREFVEEMYREIMGALEEARARNARGEASMFSAPSREAKPGAQLVKPGQKKAPASRRARADHVIWVHRCTPLVNKIYMANPPELAKIKMLSIFELAHMATLYVEDGLLSTLLPQFDRGQTLWAELTVAGRRKIAEASDPKLARPAVTPKKGAPTPRLGVSQAAEVKAHMASAQRASTIQGLGGAIKGVSKTESE